MRSHTKCTQTTHAQGCALTRVWRHTHTRPGLRPHPGVDTHRCRAVPLPRCGHTHTHTHTHAQGCALTRVWTHTHTCAQGCALTRVWTHTRARTGLCLHPGVDTHARAQGYAFTRVWTHTLSSSPAAVYTVTGTPDKNIAFYCTAGHRLSSIHHTLHFIHPHIKTQASLMLSGLG